MRTFALFCVLCVLGNGTLAGTKPHVRISVPQKRMRVWKLPREALGYVISSDFRLIVRTSMRRLESWDLNAARSPKDVCNTQKAICGFCAADGRLFVTQAGGGIIEHTGRATKEILTLKGAHLFDASQDGRMLAVERNGMICVVDLRLKRTRNIARAPHSIRLSPLALQRTLQELKISDGCRYLAIADSVDSLSVIDIRTKQRVAVSDKILYMNDLAFSHDERWLAIASHGPAATLLSLQSKRMHDIHIGASQTCVTFTRDGRHVVIGDLDGRITGARYDKQKKKFVISCEACSPAWPRKESMTRLQFSPDGTSLAVGFERSVFLLPMSMLGLGGLRK